MNVLNLVLYAKERNSSNSMRFNYCLTDLSGVNCERNIQSSGRGVIILCWGFQ